jgi:HD-GYP domain-containing protein (c-di-GMP phosphodiesterase class II)
MENQRTAPLGGEDDAGAHPLRLPLHVTLGVVFTSLFVVFGLVLVGFSYVEGRRTALLGADDLMSRIGEHMRTEVANLYVPAQGLVDLLSTTESVDGLESRVDVFLEALEIHQGVAAVYVGTETGSFFLVRALEDGDRAARVLAAPPGSRFAVQSIVRQPAGQTVAENRFYDADRQLLATSEGDARSFDPRAREWYRRAAASAEPVSTDFYVFHTTGEVGLTFARRLAAGRGVVALDLALEQLSADLDGQRATPSTRLAVVDEAGRVIVQSDRRELLPAADGSVEVPLLGELGDPVYDRLAGRLISDRRDARFRFNAEGRQWLGSWTRLPTRSGEVPILLATVIPRDELLADVDRLRNTSLLLSGGLLVLGAGAVVWVSRSVSRSLRGLAAAAERIRRFKLSTPVRVRSRIAEVDGLAATMAVMTTSLERFFAISRALSAEKDFGTLLEMILLETCRIAHADGGAILLVDDDESALEVALLYNTRTGAHVGGTSGRAPELPEVPLQDASGRDIDREAVERLHSVQVDDVTYAPDLDTTRARARYEVDGYRVQSLLSVPLADQQGEVVGVLQLVNARSEQGQPCGFEPEAVPSIEALSADAAVALDLRRLLQAQRDLLDAFIHVVAGAIDAKSPYTHGHCQRVPVIARRLAEAAHEADDGPFAGFRLSDDEWYELHIASWLHDCGKVTTPEYVVDKATRLETLHDRIHEIRTRFEVLWRDAEIDHLRALLHGGESTEALERRYADRLQEIRDDWTFVAECNLGETFMDDERVERLRRIGGQTWLRHLDDRIGVSHEELERKRRMPEADLPVAEPLLADKREHIVERPAGSSPFGDNRHGFQMEVPEHLYHRGELYNLSIRRGTLTAEERFKINEHIVQTINMLGRMPFPRQLRRVPDWAGNHHEKLDGSGYPRRLGAAELSVSERIMAIADIFEALTATDRPYMRPKTLSTALGIMASMRDSGHICPDLFDLFLSSGAYLDYGREHLDAEQLDAVDVGELIRSA